MNMIIIFIIRLILAMLCICWVKYEGKSKIPKDGALIIAPTHGHEADILLATQLCWRQIHFVAKTELFVKKLTAWWFDKGGVIEIDRTKPKRPQLTAINNALIEERAIVLFPQGTRYRGKGIGNLETGIVFFARRSKVNPKIAPVGITYKKGPFFGFPVLVNVKCGNPIDTKNYFSLNIGDTSDSARDSGNREPKSQRETQDEMLLEAISNSLLSLI